tara:strand:+ start:57 stop:524 length:468 start_codon:yes stop_codon:yes gene_type:complete
MINIIIGCDPDVDGKGYAIYENGVLKSLEAFCLIDLFNFIDETSLSSKKPVELHIEDVAANSSSQFNWVKLPQKDKRKQDAINAKISEKVGRCKQAQLEVEKIAEHFNIKIVRHKVSKKWKDVAGRKEFERLTGWKGRSNPDTRSAAWFGYLGSR